MFGHAADEEDDAPPEGYVSGEVERLPQVLSRLVQVDDQVVES